MLINVLIVDDSEMARNFHSYILKSEGFETISAVDGADALEKLYQLEKVDLVVTDINMPVMDGYTFVERIREDDQFEDLPIVIVSTEDEAKDKQRGFDAGANVYIVKPTEPEELVENIKLLLG
jgi:two-component system chemotaxis response regulator CheY